MGGNLDGGMRGLKTGVEAWPFLQFMAETAAAEVVQGKRRPLRLASQLLEYSFPLTCFVTKILALMSVNMDSALSKGISKSFCGCEMQSQETWVRPCFPLDLIGFSEWLGWMIWCVMQWYATGHSVSQILMLWAGSLLSDLNDYTKGRAGIRTHNSYHFVVRWLAAGASQITANLWYPVQRDLFLPFTCYIWEHTSPVIPKSGAPLGSNNNSLPNKTAQWLATVYLALNWNMASKKPYLHFSLHHLPSFPDILPYLPSLLCSLSSNVFWSLQQLIRETTLRGITDLSYVLQPCKFALT